MSEAEKRRRFAYKQNRKKWILIQIIAMSVIFAIALGCFAAYYQLNKNYYINYSEEGTVDYKVSLKDNEFYDEEWQNGNKAYIADLINNVDAEFNYVIDVGSSAVDFDYKYSVEAKLLVIHKDSGKAVYSPVYVLTPEVSATANGKTGIKINDNVTIDYAKYNEIANSIIETYSLKNHESKLVVTMNVDVLGKSADFADDFKNAYSVSLNIPLAVNTVAMNQSASVQTTENTILASIGSINKNVFKIISIVATILDVLALGGFIAFIYLTRNEDINYTIKLKRLVSSYRSYIQQLENDFNTDGYQILSIKTFNEMLGIRDTIQSPILMNENEDKTMTKFYIPTNTDLVYIYELKVENYDELYNITPVEEEEADSVESDVDADETVLDEDVIVSVENDTEESVEETVEDSSGDDTDEQSGSEDGQNEPEEKEDGQELVTSDTEDPEK